MRALIYDGELKLERHISTPTIQEGQALLRMRRAGICNTDLELIAGYMDFSGILGHEFVAEVVEGPHDLLGKRVVGEINVACGNCEFCNHQIPSQCINRTTVGIAHHQGAFADFLGLKTGNLYVVPDSISDDAAVFVEPLAAALQITEAIHILPRDRVIIIGAGKLGMLAAQVLRLTGANIIVIVRRQEQAVLLSKWQIPATIYDDLPKHSADVVVDCTGTESGFKDSLSLIKSRGTIVLKSTYHGHPTANLTQIAVDEIKVVGSRCGPFSAALRLLSMDLIDVNSLIEARYEFDNVLQAVEHAANKGAMKVLLDF